MADLIAQGNVVGWLQGRMEYGPRALGNRSILGSPCLPDMQKKLNLKIKYREGFRPFARQSWKKRLPPILIWTGLLPICCLSRPFGKTAGIRSRPNYDELKMYDRLYQVRSDVPAITHIDYSARIQSINKSTNERFWRLLEAFKKKTGYGVLVNTSFNVRGEPIVCTPDDAYRCFMRTEMDYLVLGRYLFKKDEQPAWNEEKNWREEFQLD